MDQRDYRTYGEGQPRRRSQTSGQARASVDQQRQPTTQRQSATQRQQARPHNRSREQAPNSRQQHTSSWQQRTDQQRAAGQQRRPSQSHSAQRFSRDSYASRGQTRRAPAGARGGQRRPTKASRSRSTYTGPSRSNGPSLKPIIIALVAILAIVVLLTILDPLGCRAKTEPEKSTASQTTKSSATTNVQVPSASSGSIPVKLPTPIMAQSAGIDLHCAVNMNDLTEILIHNASYSFACEITTELEEATNTEVIAKHGTGRDKAAQPTGDQWMTGEFIRCYREGNAGPVMSAIDCGGPVGATVYAPVSGTVVLVKEYKLYGEYDDIQIHIQPDGRSDLDVVLIHLTDASVKAGDYVEAGETPIGRIRDVFEYVGDSMQLLQYTAEGDNGNHTHIAVNDVTNPEYHGLDDLKPAAETSTTTSQPVA